MSRGPGHIERAIRALFDAHPDLAFVTDEVCEHCYPGVVIEKKHRVAVLRAARNVLKDDPNWAARSDHHQGNRWIFWNHDSVQSHHIAHAVSHPYYRSPKRAARTVYDRRTRYGMRFRLPYGTLVNEWRAQRGEAPIDYSDRQRVRQRQDVPAMVDLSLHDQYTGDVVWHRLLRDSDEETRQTLLYADRTMMKLGMSGYVAWLRDRAQWATRPDVWLKRYLADGQQRQGNTYIPPESAIQPSEAQRLADLARRLITENDPDAIRAGLAEIVAALDALHVGSASA